MAWRNSSRLDSLLLFVFCATVCLTASSPAAAFETWRHGYMSVDALEAHVSDGGALPWIRHGSMRPDLDGCLNSCYCPSFLTWLPGCPADSTEIVDVLSAQHFDNNQLLPSIINVQAKVDAARAILLEIASRSVLEDWYDDYKLAWIIFGEALHTLQDFYSHSNWVECNRSLVSVGGNIGSLPLWDGGDWLCNTSIGGVSLSTLQTGYVEIGGPPGSVTHDQLNKDGPSSPQSVIDVRDVFFPFPVIANHYEIVSGQLGGSFNTYREDGAAPRHSIKAYNALFTGGAVFELYPTKVDGDRAANQAKALTILELMAVAAADPTLQADAQALDALLAGWDFEDPESFPLDLFDANGLPIDPGAAAVPPTGVATLEQNFPNPFNPVTTIHFRTALPGPVRLDIYDIAGKRVRTLVDEHYAKGSWAVKWNGTDDAGRSVAAGTYMYVLSLGDYQQSRRMILVK
jgi:hypothetical protein